MHRKFHEKDAQQGRPATGLAARGTVTDELHWPVFHVLRICDSYPAPQTSQIERFRLIVDVAGLLSSTLIDLVERSLCQTLP